MKRGVDKGRQKRVSGEVCNVSIDENLTLSNGKFWGSPLLSKSSFANTRHVYGARMGQSHVVAL